nr:MAG TPA: hypothetical protein [Caudoviricetes sp.]
MGQSPSLPFGQAQHKFNNCLILFLINRNI